jgi:peptide/nickel transport system permease protein
VGRYIANRIILLIVVLFVVSTVVFFVFRILPGDVASIRLGTDATPEAVARLREQLGLNRPIYIQYIEWLGRAVQGNLGTSWVNKQPVLSLVLEKLPATAELALFSVALGSVFALPIGIFSALKRNSLADQVLRGFSLLGYCLPSYWFAILLILFFAVNLGKLPAGGYASAGENLRENLRFALLPTVTMAVAIAARMSRFVRSSVLDVLRQDYMRTARAKGLFEWVVLSRHGLRNALIPIVTMLGLELGTALSGLIVTEQIFTWPGLGWLSVQAVFQRDYELLQGTVLLSAAFYSVVNLMVDILVAYLDPRITY